MTKQNIEVVRRSFAALDRAFDSYWESPRSIAAAMEAEDWPEWEEAFDYIHPDVEWQTVFLGETFHGRASSSCVGQLPDLGRGLSPQPRNDRDPRSRTASSRP